MKGVSAIIATILLLIITIGLAGTAYVYISGMMTGKMVKAISVLDTSCNGTHITLVVSNDGTDTIAVGEITFFVNNVLQPSTIGALNPRSVNVTTIPGANTGASNSVLVVSPSNSVRSTIWCP